jgi:hypothetical protein
LVLHPVSQRYVGNLYAKAQQNSKKWLFLQIDFKKMAKN